MTLLQFLPYFCNCHWNPHFQLYYHSVVFLAFFYAYRYFIENADRICCPEYTPTKQDILQSQKHTMGTTELTFSLEGSAFRITDVGGQRSQRRKWWDPFFTSPGFRYNKLIRSWVNLKISGSACLCNRPFRFNFESGKKKEMWNGFVHYGSCYLNGPLGMVADANCVYNSTDEVIHFWCLFD